MVSIILLIISFFVLAQSEGPYRELNATAHLMKPAQQKFSEADLKKLSVPKNFKISVFAKDLEDPRMMVVDDQDYVYVSRPKKGDILRLKDTNGDGQADEIKTIVAGIDKAHGMALHQDKLYFIAVKELHEVDLTKTKYPLETKTLIKDLPDGGQHANRNLNLGPDGLLYINVGSTCNLCDETNKESATIMKIPLDGKNRQVFAHGLRDSIGFDWHPETKELFAFDQGADWKGDDLPLEELNHIQEGAHYGWPFCYGNKQVEKNLIANPKDSTKEKFCTSTTSPLLTSTAHSAPLALKFYSGHQFPENYKNSAFVAFHGSWNRRPPSGYKVSRIIFKKGKPTGLEDFLTGFLRNKGHSQLGRPAGLAFTKDGSLLVSDDSAGVIYRISYENRK
jgi:glucose/arabinose dehydrogenase